jgi:hypothetical protein
LAFQKIRARVSGTALASEGHSGKSYAVTGER